jgi:hypothetical protein
MRRSWKGLAAFVLGLVALILGGPSLYVASYAILVNTHCPSLDENGKPTYRSSYPLISSRVQWDRQLTWIFPKQGFATRLFLPADLCWRSLNGLPPATIQNEAAYWSEYIDYLVEVGVVQRKPKRPDPALENPTPEVPADESEPQQ